MEKGTCPACNGTGHMPCPDHLRKYGVSNGWYGYRAEDDTVTCTNCGGQTMYGQPTGKVNLRKDNRQPCVHEYESKKLGNCYHGYTCRHCDFNYSIDSGD